MSKSAGDVSFFSETYYSIRDAFQKKNSKIWDIGPKGGRGSGLNPNFSDILIGTNTLGGRGSEGLCLKKNAINFCSPCSSFMYFRVI